MVIEEVKALGAEEVSALAEEAEDFNTFDGLKEDQLALERENFALANLFLESEDPSLVEASPFSESNSLFKNKNRNDYNQKLIQWNSLAEINLLDFPSRVASFQGWRTGLAGARNRQLDFCPLDAAGVRVAASVASDGTTQLFH